MPIGRGSRAQWGQNSSLGLLVGCGDVAGGVHADRPGRLAELVEASRKSCEKGAKRAGGPPMIASISEKP